MEQPTLEPVMRSRVKLVISLSLILPMHLALVVFLGVELLMVVPRFAMLYADMGSVLPVPTQLVLGVSSFVRQTVWLWAVLTPLALAADMALLVVLHQTGRKALMWFYTGAVAVLAGLMIVAIYGAIYLPMFAVAGDL